MPTGPIMPGPPPRLSSTTLGADVSPSAASEPTPMSSQFVRQHLMQASAMQSIAAANDTLYPAMPDVSGLYWKVALGLSAVPLRSCVVLRCRSLDDGASHWSR